MQSTQRASELPRHLVWASYVIGAFGLGVSQQGAFLVPLRAHELGASFQIIGVIVAATAVVPSLTSVPIGGVIDRFGSRRSFILGSGMTVLVGLGFMTATSYWALLGLQMLLGTFRTMAWLASQTYITTLGQQDERAGLAGRFALFTNIGTMVGPLVAGLVAQLVGYRLAFAWLAFYAFVFFLLGLILVETHVPTEAQQAGDKRRGGFRQAAGQLKLRGMQVALLLTFARLWNDKLWTSFYPVLLADIGFQPGVIGTVVFTKGMVATLFAPTAGFFARFTSPQTLAAVSLGFGSVALVLSPHMTAVPQVYLAPVLLGIGVGLSLPMLFAIVSEAAPDGERGVALGLRMTVNQVAGGTAPVMFGPLVAVIGAMGGFAIGGAVSAAALIGSRVLHALDRPRSPVPERRGQDTSPGVR